MVGVVDTFGSGQRDERVRACVSINASERGTPTAIDSDEFQKSVMREMRY
jgi:hypothetical protein